jgi:serine/threonine-protein kinase
MALTVGTRIGAYEIIGTLGAGGMGEVYRARDTRLKREVAVKILPESFASEPDRLVRFQREAEVLASLNHPNIAAIYGLEESDGTRALVMELVDGPTLADRIAQGPIPVDEALLLAKQIAEAVEAAHEQGIIHRDLKPANIKVRPDGTVKILDFGLAKALEPTGAMSPNVSESPTITSPAMMTGVGVLLGTAAYMSPEQARGRPADKRSDVWSFGCVLYEMLTGRRAFEGEDTSETLAFVLTKEPDWRRLPPSLHPSVKTLLRRCLERDRRNRVGDISTALYVLSDASTLGVQITSSRDTKGIGAATWRRLFPAVAAAGAALLAGTAVWWTTRPAPSRLARTEIGTFGATLIMQGSDRDVALVPDGSRLIYRGDDQLFVRAIDRLEPERLSGLGNPRSPFVSPDGQWIGYFDGNTTLKKVSITGGPAVTIARTDGIGSRGAAWSADGMIYFATNATDTGIHRVSADGGEPMVLTKPNHENGEQDHLWPELLPGSQTVLFTITATVALENAQIAVLDLATGTYKVVVRGGSHGHYVPTGHLVYSAGGSIRAVGFDLRRMEATGTAVPVLDGVMTFGNGGVNASFAENGTMVYVRGESATSTRTPRSVVWVDRQGREEPVNVGVRAFVGTRLSPAEPLALFQIADEDNDIWTLDFGRRALTRQTFELAEDETPVWSPDGKWIAWASIDQGASTIFRRRADGTGAAEALWRAPSTQVHTHVSDWTPDGRTLLISRVGAPESPRADVAVLPVDGPERNPKPLLRSAFNMDEARLSPDGRWLAYRSNESGREQVYVQAYPSLEGKWQISTAGGAEPVWSRKGDELFYRGEGSLMAVGVSGSASFSASTPRKIFDDPYFVNGGRAGYDVSADGQRFLMVKNLDQDKPVAPPQIILVQNWFEELKRLVPTN